MANQNDILISIKVDDKDAIKSVSDIDSNVENLNKSIKSLEDVTTSAFTDMDESIEGASDSYNKFGKAAKESAQETEDGSKKSNKALGLLKKGATGLGTAFKAMGIGALVALLAALWEAMKKNQTVMDAVNKVMETVSIIFNKVTTAIVDAYTKVSDATGGFDAMKIVIINLLKLAITPLKLGFLAIKASVLTAQLAWEKSIFGGKDADKIKTLEEDLAGVKAEVIQIGVDTYESGLAIAENIGEAVSEVGQLVQTVAEDVVETVKGINLETVASMAETLVEMRKNLGVLEIQQEATNLKALRAAEIQRQIRDSEEKTFEQRIEANEALGEILDEQLENEQVLLDEKIRIAEFELEMDEENHEKQLELMRLVEVEQAELQERITGQKSEQLVNRVALEKEYNTRMLNFQMRAQAKSLKEIKKNESLIVEFTKQSQDEILKKQLETNIARIEDSTLTEEQKFELMMNAYDAYEAELVTKQDAQLEKEKKDDDEITKNKIDNAQAALAVFSVAMDIMNNATKLRFETQKNELEENQSLELSLLEEKHKAEIENFSGTSEEKVILLEKQKREEEQLERDQKTAIDKIRYEEEVAGKKAAILNAALQGAMAILSMAATGGVPGAVAAAILTTLNIGLVKSAKIEPAKTFARGGVFEGPSHADGGILTPFGEVEGGEGIINNVSMANPNLRNLASAANEAGGGESFGDGSAIKVVVTNFSDMNVSLNTNELNETQDDIDIIDSESYL